MQVKVGYLSSDARSRRDAARSVVGRKSAAKRLDKTGCRMVYHLAVLQGRGKPQPV